MIDSRKQVLDLNLEVSELSVQAIKRIDQTFSGWFFQLISFE